MKNYNSLTDALNGLKERGYVADFGTDTVCLYCGEIDIRFHPEEFQVDEVYHFEGNSNPQDRSVLYAITSSTGIKGTLTDTSGTYPEHLNPELIKKLQHHHHTMIFQ
jgi:hypothetical protein